MHRVLVVGLPLTTTACDTPSAEPSVTTVTTTVTTAVTTAAPATTGAPTTPPTTQGGSLPSEMEGVWRTDPGDADRVTLTLADTAYRIDRGPNSGNGDISVDGDRIVFSGSSLCGGAGTYRWSVEGDSLTFSLEDSGDPCSGRTSVLDGVTYTR